MKLYLLSLRHTYYWITLEADYGSKRGVHSIQLTVQYIADSE